MEIITVKDFNDEEMRIFESMKKPDKPCTVDELTNEEKRIWCFMNYSESVNGTVIVPPWMLDKAKEIYKKLGIKEH